jgi:hypothetical protein
MANYWALSAGNWSNVSNWLTGTSPGDPAGALPGPEDDVYANARVIYIDGNFAAKRITNLSAENIARRGGYFTIGDGFTLSAYVHGSLQSVDVAPWTACLQFLSASPASATLVGSLCAGDRVPGTFGGIDGITGDRHFPIALINFGNFTIFGNVEGGTTGNSGGFSDDSRIGVVHNYGNLTIYGNVSGTRIDAGNNHVGFIGIRNRNAGNITVYGNVNGGVNWGGAGIFNTGTGTCRVFGDIANSVVNLAQFAYAIYTNTTTTLLVSGNVYGGAVNVVYSNNYTLLTLGPTQITGTLIGRNNSAAWQINSGNTFLLQTPNQPYAVIGGNNGSSVGIRQDGGTLTLSGNVYGQQAYGLLRAGGTTTVYGNARGGTGQPAIFLAGGTNALTIIGNVSGSAFGTGAGLYCGAGSTVRNVTISGDLYSSPDGGMAFGDDSGTANCTINIYGNLYGRPASTSNSGPIDTRSNGIINIFGDLIYRGNSYTLLRVYTGNKTINLVGNIRPLSPNISQYGGGIEVGGADAGQSVTVNVTGDVVGGTVTNTTGGGSGAGISCGSANINFVNVFGTVKGGLAAPGIQNSGSATTIYARRVQGNDVGPSNNIINGIGYTARPGIQNSSATGRVFVEEIVFGSQGAPPVSGPVFMVPKSTNVTVLNTGPTTGFTSVTLFRSTNFPGFTPEERDVRQGVVYGAGEFTGKMIIPNPDSVQLGVPVDNTRGRAALTPISVWNFSRSASLSAGSIGERVRNALTTQAAGKILASFNLSGAS